MPALLRACSYYLGRLLGRNSQSLAHVAQRTEEISPAIRMRALRPYFDRAHLSRIGAARNFSAEQVISEHLLRQHIDFPPVRVHWVKDAWIINGSVFVRGARRIELRNVLQKRALLERYSLRPRGPRQDMESAVLVSTSAGSTWFGHWLEDEVPLHMLGRTYGEPVALAREEYSHEAGYLKAFQLPHGKRVREARFGELIVVDEFAQNPNKTARYHTLRERLGRFPQGAKRVYLSRGLSGTPRRLINEQRLCERLSKEGFEILDVGKAAFETIVAVCRGAAIVIGIEGSHLAHALFMMKDYGTMLILNPPNQVHTTVADIAVFCRLHAGMFVCEPAGSDRTGFVADEDEVLRFLHDLLTHSEGNRRILQDYVDEVIAIAKCR